MQACSTTPLVSHCSGGGEEPGAGRGTGSEAKRRQRVGRRQRLERDVTASGNSTADSTDKVPLVMSLPSRALGDEMDHANMQNKRFNSKS